MWANNWRTDAAVDQLKKKILDDKVLSPEKLARVDMEFFVDGCIHDAQVGLSGGDLF